MSDGEVFGKDILCCQFCGRVVVATREVFQDWFVDYSRQNPNQMVIRCPQHISEWAMRQSRSGRTRANREKALRGRMRAAPALSGLEPIPLGMGGSERPTDGYEWTLESALLEAQEAQRYRSAKIKRKRR